MTANPGTPGSGPVLVTGAGGYLGSCVVEVLRGSGVEVVTAGRRDQDVVVDLDDPAGAAAAVAGAGAAWVLHVAARARPDECAADPEGARRVNATAAGALARAVGGHLLHVSTDLVFGGDRAPYRAGDPPAPLQAYGRSKAEGERAVLAEGGLVVRLPLLFGPTPQGGRGATGVLRAALAGELALFANEFRTPLHVRDAARGLAAVLGRRGPGVLHLAGPERVSRLELGRRWAARQGVEAGALQATECTDPERPRDVALVGDLPVRSLDAMLAEA